jgi:hypothetical protein
VFGAGGENTYPIGQQFELRVYAYNTLTGEPFTDWMTTPPVSGDFQILSDGEYVVPTNAVPDVDVENELILTFTAIEAAGTTIPYKLEASGGEWIAAPDKQVLYGLSSTMPIGTFNANVISVNGGAFSSSLFNTVVYASATNTQEPDKFPLVLTRNKSYLVANSNPLTWFLESPGVTTADAAYLTIRNLTTDTVSVSRQVSADIDTDLGKVTVELSAAQTAQTAGNEFRYMVELRHGAVYQEAVTGVAIFKADLQEA